MPIPLINTRIKALREKRGLKQDELASLLGFKDRQTVSAIETGVRRVSAQELLLLSEKLGVSLDYFADRFLLAGEGRFSWRETGSGAERLDAYERKAERWIAAFKTLAPQVGHKLPLFRCSLGLTCRSSFEDAMQAGEQFVDEFKLGEVPAQRLAEVMEKELGVLVLMVDAEESISGAACRLPALDTVLISRHEVIGRRHFNLAHELFHILTWEAMPPEHSEKAEETSDSRVEQLANNFASALLMPTRVIRRFGGWGKLSQEKLIARLNSTAAKLCVTSSALKWRLVSLGELNREIARSLPSEALRNNGREVEETFPPPLFSQPFAKVMALAIDDGRISVRRASRLLGMTVIEDLEDLFAAHGVKSPIAL